MSDLRQRAIKDVAEATDELRDYLAVEGIGWHEVLDFLRELQQRRQADRWIPVEEKLPDYGSPVLVIYHGVVQHTVYVRDVGEYRDINDNSDSMPESFVSHWRPLPAPERTGP